MGLLNVKTSFNISLQYTTAPIHIRFFAWVIDNVLLLVYLLLCIFFIVGNLKSFEWESGILVFLYLPFFLYHLFFELFNKGQSLGKMTLGIKVVSADGKEESNTQAMVRWLLRTLDFGGIIFIAILWTRVDNVNFISTMLMLSTMLGLIVFLTTKYNQRLGDLAAGTVVVYKKLPYDINDTIFRDLEMTNYKVQFPEVMKLSDNDINVIDNVLKRHRKSKIETYLTNITLKVKTALNIESDLEDDIFLEMLLNDYNFLSQK